MKRIFKLLVLLVVVINLWLVFVFVNSSKALALGNNIQKSELINSGLDRPTGLEFAPDGRLFIIQYNGDIKIFKNGQLLPQVFAHLPAYTNGDLGLIGITFDPDFANNKFSYFYYIDANDHLIKLVRFDATSDVATSAPINIFTSTYAAAFLHGGGALNFGPDGKLYVDIGDNGYPQGVQNLLTTQGKILRMNKDGSVPSDNPFVGRSDANPLVWATGLRNPFRAQFDSLTGKFYVSDVGDTKVEEINLIEKGKNYGWPICEGPCNNSSFTNPYYSYSRINDGGAIVVGSIYRKSMFPSEYQGSIFFSDYVKGFIKRLQVDANGNVQGVVDFDPTAGPIVDMKAGPDGALYALSYAPGKVLKYTYNSINQPPVAKASADIISGKSPLTVNFSSNGSNDPQGNPLTYSWDFGDGTTSVLASPQKIYSNKGKYTVTLTVNNGSLSSTSAPFDILVGTAPIINVNSPIDGSNYKAGDVINYSASSIDENGNAISDQNMTTTIIWHHDQHTHPFVGPFQNGNGNFTIPVSGEESPNTWYEIIYSATDSNGLYTKKSIFIYPLKSQVSLITNPQGLQILLDATPQTSPYTFIGVQGFQRELNVVTTQTLNGRTYQFTSWSDGQTQKHNISIPIIDTTYTANFNDVTANSFSAQYYNNKDLSGNPTLSRIDQQINFDWGAGSPDPMIPVDNFSARWTKTDNFISGKYRFNLNQVDNGARLKIDGKIVFEKWIDAPPSSHTIDVDITVGSHTIVLEYFEMWGNASIKMDYSKISDITPAPTPTPLPTQTPVPTPTPTPTPLPGNGSVIKIYAAGSPAAGVYPIMQLLIDDQVVATFNDVRGDYNNRQTNEYNYTNTSTVKVSQIKIAYINDQVINSEDRNLFVDKMILDGTTYETEASTTYSTGTWDSSTGCAPGNKRSEYIQCNGYFSYAALVSPSSTEIKIIAEGTACQGIYPDMQIDVDGNIIQTFSGITPGLKEYNYTYPFGINPSQIKIRFPNDCFVNGDDRNLRVNKLTVNGSSFDSVNPNTFSNGSWNSATGCSDGYKQSEWLNCSGYFKYQ